jgi:thymidylate synthase ThyX
MKKFNMFKAEILADSLSPQGNRLTTMKVTFPRFILAEFNTHRMFSRNSASSRAIPFAKMVKMVEENPFIPIAWQKDHKAMQGSEYLTDFNAGLAHESWLEARDNTVKIAKELNYGNKVEHDTHGGLNVSKQLCNRLLEPFMWHTVIVTATEWENFFKLRCPQYHTPVSGEGFYFRSKKDCIANHSDSDNISKLENMTDLEWLQINQSQAEIHIQAIAELMWDAMNESVPNSLKAGEWHIPFGDNIDTTLFPSLVGSSATKESKESLYNSTKIKIATARCARISYETLGDNPKIDYEADIRLHDMLTTSGHWSPFEHCARVMNSDEANSRLYVSNGGEHGWSGNFRGFIQYRKLIEYET